MGAIVTTMRAAAAAMLAAILLFGVAARAEDVPAPVQVEEPWQLVITSQIEAFRAKDAPGAFQYASAGFHTTFPSAEAFFVAIISSGYAPIMESRSHSFGRFQKLGDKAVVQEVQFVGNDQSLYGAIYMLAEEANGWRVQGVQLAKQAGVGI